MRKITEDICRAFVNGQKMCIGNSETDGKTLKLHGNVIAKRSTKGIELCDGGYRPKHGIGSVTTKERLNGVLTLAGCAMRIYQKNKKWYVMDFYADDFEFHNGMIV